MEKKIENEIYSFGYRKPRYRTNFRVLVRVDDYPPRMVDALCTDVSEDGLAAEISETLAVGMKVTIVMTPPDSSMSVRVSAEVVNQNDHHYGFIFHFISQSELEAFRTYLASLRPEPIALSRFVPEPAAPKSRR